MLRALLTKAVYLTPDFFQIVRNRQKLRTLDA